MKTFLFSSHQISETCIPFSFLAFVLYAAPFLLPSHFCHVCLYLLSWNSSPSSQASPHWLHRGTWLPVTAAVCVLHALSSANTQSWKGKQREVIWWAATTLSHLTSWSDSLQLWVWWRGFSSTPCRLISNKEKQHCQKLYDNPTSK